MEDDSHNEPGAWVILSLAPERTGDVKEEPAKESDSEDGHSHFQKLHLRAERKQEEIPKTVASPTYLSLAWR